ncbi:hypothetical protein PFISCL1PPCAC_2973, partial [Pristionchus fissidentatus]
NISLVQTVRWRVGARGGRRLSQVGRLGRRIFRAGCLLIALLVALLLFVHSLGVDLLLAGPALLVRLLFGRVQVRRQVVVGLLLDGFLCSSLLLLLSRFLRRGIRFFIRFLQKSSRQSLSLRQRIVLLTVRLRGLCFLLGSLGRRRRRVLCGLRLRARRFDLGCGRAGDWIALRTLLLLAG